MESREAGERLRHYLREHMAKQGIPTLMELARRSGVGRDTLQAWQRGRRPTPGAGGKVAKVLGTRYYDLLRAFDGVSDEMNEERVLEALEWVTRAIRSGEWKVKRVRVAAVPPEAREAVERVAGRRKSRTPSHPPSA